MKANKCLTNSHDEQLVFMKRGGWKTVKASRERGPASPQVLSAMQLKKAIRKGTPAFFCFMFPIPKEEEVDSDADAELPKEIQELLEEFKDVLPEQFLKKLPSEKHQKLSMRCG